MFRIARKVRGFLSELGDLLESKAPNSDIGKAAPKELHLELTYRCDSDCVMCNLKYLRKTQVAADIGLDDIIKMLQTDMLKEIEYIILSGGEPWLNSEFPGIIECFRRRYKDSQILILSNLLNTDLIIDRISEIRSSIGLENISLGSSIDGLKDVHDNIRGVKGAFRSLVDTVLLIRKKYPGLLPTLNFTLIPDNADQIFDVYDWGRQMGLYVSFQVMVQKKETSVFKWTENKLEDVDTGINRIIEDIWERKGWNESIADRLFDNLSILFFLINFHYMAEYLRKPRRFFSDCPCGEKYAMIDPAGNLYFCPVYKDLIAGNIRSESFDSLWYGKKADEIRSFFNKKTCNCWLSCTNGIMLEEAFFPDRDVIMAMLKGSGK